MAKHSVIQRSNWGSWGLVDRQQRIRSKIRPIRICSFRQPSCRQYLQNVLYWKLRYCSWRFLEFRQIDTTELYSSLPKAKPESEQPIIVPFNPWVFSGDEDISKRFFDQVQRSLNRWKIVPKGFRDRIADVAKVVSQIPLPYAQAGNAVTTLFDDKQKTLPTLKKISKLNCYKSIRV
jgi:hypothetical protein